MVCWNLILCTDVFLLCLIKQAMHWQCVLSKCVKEVFIFNVNVQMSEECLIQGQVCISYTFSTRTCLRFSITVSLYLWGHFVQVYTTSLISGFSAALKNSRLCLLYKQYSLSNTFYHKTTFLCCNRTTPVQCSWPVLHAPSRNCAGTQCVQPHRELVWKENWFTCKPVHFSLLFFFFSLLEPDQLCDPALPAQNSWGGCVLQRAGGDVSVPYVTIGAEDWKLLNHSLRFLNVVVNPTLKHSVLVSRELSQRLHMHP